MEKSPEYTPTPQENKINKDTEGSSKSFFRRLEKPTRRDFVKIAAKAIIGLATGYVVNKEIDGLLAEYQKEKISKAIKESKDLQTSVELLGKVAEYPEMIEKSKKQTLNEFAEDISKKDFDNIIFGEWHGFGPTSEKAVYLLEELIKNNKKISAICLEGLSYTDPEHIEITKRMNTKELPLDKIPKVIGNSDLIKFAKKYSIEIIGLEKGLIEDEKDWRIRFKDISERIGEISNDKTSDGILVTYIGQAHVTTDSWKNENLFYQLAQGVNRYPSEKEASENNSTIKEYLEKINLKPIAVQIEDWSKLTSFVDSFFSKGSEKFSLEDKKIFYEIAKNKWQSYRLKEKEDFVVPYPKAKDNTYSMIIPSEISEKPPKLAEKMGDN